MNNNLIFLKTVTLYMTEQINHSFAHGGQYDNEKINFLYFDLKTQVFTVKTEKRQFSFKPISYFYEELTK